MPYRKSYIRKRKNPRYKNTATRRIARREARKVVNKTIESKTRDGAVTSTQIDYSGAVANLLADPSAATVISQGVGETQYVGTMIRPTYVKISYNWILADVTNMARVIVVQSKGLFVPTAATILQSVANVRAPLSDYETDFDDRFRVLADRRHNLDTPGNAQAVGKIKIPYSKLRTIKFSDAAGTYEIGGLYMMYITDSAAASHPLFQAYYRVHFKDA